MDISRTREVASYGLMSQETLEILVKRVFEYADGICSFTFQGGEPTLVGLKFYENLVRLVSQYNDKNIPVQHSIQTNGYTIDKEWAQFFATHHFLVGISLDGTTQTHNLYRNDSSGNGTHKEVMRAIQLLKNDQVDFNVVTVVTNQIARNIDKIYSFYMRNGLRYQQYIPCLDPLGEKRGQEEYSLSPAQYGNFLKILFDRWYADISHGRFVYIRYFHNLLGMLKGYNPESCGMSGHCAIQYVVESDGSVYPCDFYVIDKYKMGNLYTDSIRTLEKSLQADDFIKPSLKIDDDCKGCQWFSLCRGGCRRDRRMEKGELGKYYFCESVKEFLPYAYPRLHSLSQRV